MATLWSCGFELNSLSPGVEVDDTQGDAAIVTSPVKSGLYALKAIASGAYKTSAITHEFISESVLYFSTAIYLDEDTDFEDAIVSFQDDLGRVYIAILLTPVDRSLSLYNARQFRYIGNNSAPLNLHQWYEVGIGIDATDPTHAIVSLYINNHLIVSEITNLNSLLGLNFPYARDLTVVQEGIGLISFLENVINYVGYIHYVVFNPLSTHTYLFTLTGEVDKLTTGTIYFDDSMLENTFPATTTSTTSSSSSTSSSTSTTTLPPFRPEIDVEELFLPDETGLVGVIQTVGARKPVIEFNK